MIENFRSLSKHFGEDIAEKELVRQSLEYQKANIPVHEWQDFNIVSEPLKDAKNKVYKIMTGELFVIAPDDLVELVRKIMEWKNIHHVPVVDKEHKIVGMINKQSLDLIDFTLEKNHELTAKEIMNAEFVSTHPDTLIVDLKKELQEKNLTSAAVIYQEELIGIVTSHDLEMQKN